MSIEVDSDLQVANYHAAIKDYLDKDNWKMPTKPFFTESPLEADFQEMALQYFLGGSERETFTDGKIKVTSRGYYWYIGA